MYHFVELIISGGGVDYVSGPYTVIFPAGNTSSSFDISITVDNLVELNETIDLTIQSTSLPTGASVSDPSQATVIIMNSDRKLNVIAFCELKGLCPMWSCLCRSLKND